MEPNALVVDDRSESRELVAGDLVRAGFRITEACDGVDGWQRFQRRRPDVVVSDLTMPGSDGLELLKRIRRVSTVPVILFSASGGVGAAVAAIKAGAQEFFRYPFDRGRIAARARALACESGELEQLQTRLVGSSPEMRRVRERVCALAPLRVPVLVSGEAGTGRDHVVRCIADVASESEGGGRFVKLTRDSVSDVRRPDAHCLYYLDEVDTFRPADQVRWLAWLREFERGRASDVPRVLASTLQSSLRLATGDSVDPELAHQLLRFEIPLVPLRERRGDISELALHLARRISAEMEREQVHVEREALDMLGSQTWTGNVRELTRVLEKLVAFSPGGQVTGERVREVFGEVRGGVATLREQRNLQQRDELVALLETCGGNIAEVARRQGLSRGAVIYRAQKYGLLPRTRP